jgi:Na+/melibiose symporter-like transporter
MSSPGPVSVVQRTAGWRLAIFVAPLAIIDMALWASGYVIPTFYARATGLSLELIGVVILASRLVDAVTDPMMGYLADRTETRWGRRKHWLVVGAPVFMVGIFMLLTPSSSSGIGYFSLAWIIMYLGYTVVGVPYSSWMMELTRSYDGRQRVATFRAVASFSGSLVFMLMPLLMSRWTGTTAFTAGVLEVIAWTVVIAFALIVPLVVATVPREERLSLRHIELRALPTMFTRNRPYRIFIAAYLCWGLGAGIWAKTTYLYVDSYLRIPEMFPFLLAGTFIVRLLAIPFWSRLVGRSQKKTIWLIGVLGLATTLPLIAFVAPGKAAFLPLLFLSMMVGLFDAAVMMLPFSMIGDIADYDSYRNGFDRTASFEALQSLMTKVVLAVGGGGGFILAGLFGFEAGAENTSFAETGLKLTALGLPAVAFVMAGLIIRSYPLDRARHAEIIGVQKRAAAGEQAA